LRLEDSGKVESTSWLVLERRTEPTLALFRTMAVTMQGDTTTGLIGRMQRTSDPLQFYLIHLMLDQRGIGPCLRWPARQDHPQLLYINWLADVLWIAKQLPGHQPLYKRWNGLFVAVPLSAAWHKTAYWAYGSKSAGCFGQGHYFAQGLGLSDDQRQDLMTMPTSKMRANRRLIARLPEFKASMLEHAHAHPDKSGAQTPERVSERRGQIMRGYLLSGRSKVKGCAYHSALYGESLSRQAYTRQLQAIEYSTGQRLL
jgi:hypothetical protein